MAPMRTAPARIIGRITGCPAPSGSVPPRIVPRIVISHVPVPPRIVRIAPPRIGRTEAETEIPAVVVDRDTAPRSEHRSNVFGLYPHLVAHDDHIIERRIVGRDIIPCRAVVAEFEIARRQIVGHRLKPPQTACIGAFIVVGDDTVVGKTVVIGLFRRRSLCFGQPGFPLRLPRLGGRTARFGFRLLPLGDRGTVMHGIKVVVGAAVRTVIGGRTPGQSQCQSRYSDDDSYFFHSACIFASVLFLS